MAWLFHPLMMLIARSSESDLAKQVEFLKAENQMLRRRLGKLVRPTTEEWELTGPPAPASTEGEILCRERLGGVLKHYCPGRNLFITVLSSGSHHDGNEIYGAIARNPNGRRWLY